jgi:hypothetical protein
MVTLKLFPVVMVALPLFAMFAGAAEGTTPPVQFEPVPKGPVPPAQSIAPATAGNHATPQPIKQARLIPLAISDGLTKPTLLPSHSIGKSRFGYPVTMLSLPIPNRA